MIALSAEEAAAALGIAGFSTGVMGISIDSRTIRPGEVFVALRGERFDGHDFVPDVIAIGAAGVVVDSEWWDGGKNPIVEALPRGARQAIYSVADTLDALGKLANAVRRKSQAVVIAVTGSVGKTGTKDLLGMMAARAGRVVVTPANQNNEVGVPLTLLSIELDTVVAVVEMGMRGLGQIASLTKIAEPDVGVITNIHPVHLELLGSLEDVAKAKVEVLGGLRPSGVGVVPAECTVLEPHLVGGGKRILRFGLEEDRRCSDVWGEYERQPGCAGAWLRLHWPNGEAELRTSFSARAKMENAVAATAACYAAKLPVKECLKGLEEAVFTASRGDLERVGDWLVIDDTYNASPAAVRAAVDELVCVAAERGARSVAVLGDMLELGEKSAEYHAAAGAYAAEKGVSVLWGVGSLSVATVEGFNDVAGAEIAGHVESAGDFAPVLATLLPGDVILFKASRSLKLEIMVGLLRKAAAGEG